MSLSFVLVKNLVGPPGSTGAAGRTIYNSAGPPAAGTGTLGDFYLDTTAIVLYGPKTSATAWPATGVSLVGPAGPSTPQTLPSDLKANSLVVAPVAGDANAQLIEVLDSSGNVKFLADATGNVTAAGATAVASLKVTQSASVNSSGQTTSSVVFPGAFGGSGSYPASGIASDARGNLIFSYQGYPFLQTQNTGYSPAVGNVPSDTAALLFSCGAYKFTGGGSTLIQASPSAIVLGPTTSSYSIPTTINTYSGTVLQLQKNNSTVTSFDTTGSGTLSGNLTVAGSVTAGSIANSGQNSAASHQATGNGSAGAPSYSFGNQTDTGAYLATQSTTAAVLGLAVNGAQALALAKSGVAVSGTLSVAGTTTLAATNAGAVTSSGAVTATGLTISAAGGKLTFGDGTSMTTAATGTSASTGSGAASVGSAPSHVGPFGLSAATGTCKGVNGGTWVFVPETSVALTGATFFASAATAGSSAMTVQSLPIGNGQATPTAVATFATVTVPTQGSGFVLTLATPVTLTTQYLYIVSVAGVAVSLNGYLSITEPNGATGAAQATVFQTGNGTDAAPAYTFTNQTDTGLALPTASTTAAQMDLSVNGTQVLALKKTSVTAPVTVASATAVGTPSFVSSQGFKQTLEMGTMWTGYTGATSGSGPTSDTTMQQPIIAYSNATQSQQMAAVFVAPYPGSVLSLQAYANGALQSGNTAYFTVYKNAAATALTTSIASTTAAAGAYVTANKGAYTFAAGDVVQVYFRQSASTINQSYSARITVEMAA